MTLTVSVSIDGCDLELWKHHVSRRSTSRDSICRGILRTYQRAYAWRNTIETRLTLARNFRSISNIPEIRKSSFPHHLFGPPHSIASSFSQPYMLPCVISSSISAFSIVLCALFVNEVRFYYLEILTVSLYTDHAHRRILVSSPRRNGHPSSRNSDHPRLSTILTDRD